MADQQGPDRRPTTQPGAARGGRPPARVRVGPGSPTGAQPDPPSSKYYTLRYTLAAFLAASESLVLQPTASDDTEVLVAAVRALGAVVAQEPGALRA